MKSTEKAACLFWLVAFLAFCGVSGWFVYRRAPEGPGAFVGAIFGGVFLIVAFGWLISIPGRIREWWLILRARFGGEPHDGSRTAIVGALRGLGELHGPITNERCVLYSYKVFARLRTGRQSSEQKVYEGFAMVPLSIEHGGERTRILAEPDIAGLSETHLDNPSANANAKSYIDRTEFEPEPARGSASKDMSHGDGQLRYDYRHDPVPEDVFSWRFVERRLPADTNVCAVGEYRADRRALVAPVTLRTGSAFAIGAAWRVVNAGIGIVFCLAILLGAAAVFCANFPLDAVEQSHPQWELRWWEIDLERMVEKNVRMPMVRAGMLSTPGFYLQEVCEGCAKGRLEIDGRPVELRHAAYMGGTSVHLSAKPGDRDGVTLSRGEEVVLTINGKSAPVPKSWMQPADVETALGQGGEYSGRVTVIAPDGWIRCRAYFRTRVDPDAWLTTRR